MQLRRLHSLQLRQSFDMQLRRAYCDLFLSLLAPQLIMNVWDEVPQEYAALIKDQIDALEEEAQYQNNLDQIIGRRWMPRPLWAVRPYDHNGIEAWEKISEIQFSYRHNDPYCIYIHIPFCRSRCGYCDCYAFPLTKNEQRHIQQYTDALVQEIEMWGAQESLKERMVSTVHFGGGTPLMLGPMNLNRIISALKRNFCISGETELAFETTSSMLTEEIFITLNQMGFTRIHIGVQSLQEDVRKKIGRLESPEIVLEKIRFAVRCGWIVSTDVIIGLPCYGIHGILSDLNSLVECGVEGFSIYELVQSPRNRLFFNQFHLTDQPILDKFIMFQTAFQHLQKNGFENNLYNHLSKGKDKNEYFTSPSRHEDLLGIGTIADGYFGNFQYRHNTYLPYLKSISAKNPGLEGGLVRSAVEDVYRQLEVEIRSGKPDPLVFAANMGNEKAMDLFAKWIRLKMIRVDLSGDSCTLTPNGAWFIGRLLSEAAECIDATALS